MGGVHTLTGIRGGLNPFMMGPGAYLESIRPPLYEYCGIRPVEAGNETPAEHELMLNGAERRIRREVHEGKIQAAAILATVMKPEESRAPTDEEMAQAMNLVADMINAGHEGGAPNG